MKSPIFFLTFNGDDEAAKIFFTGPCLQKDFKRLLALAKKARVAKQGKLVSVNIE